MTSPRVALITGAGSGIGRAIAVAFSHAGYALTLVGRREDKLRETAALCQVPVHIHAADITTSTAATGAVRSCVEHHKRLDALINNAGVGVVAPVTQTTDELLDQTYRLNTFAPAWMIREAWPTFLAQHAASGVGGCVVNISSMASIDPFPGFFAYAGSKAAASVMAASITKEGAAVGVRAFSLAPGAVETPMLRAAFDESMITREQTLEPSFIANITLACVQGKHDQFNGRNIPILPDAFKAWFREYQRANPPLDAM